MADVKDKSVSAQQIVLQVSNELAKRFDAALAPSILHIIQTGVKRIANNLEKQTVPIINKQFAEIKLKVQQPKPNIVPLESASSSVQSPLGNSSAEPEKKRSSLPTDLRSDQKSSSSSSLISGLIQTITKAINQTEKRRPPLPADLKIDQKSSSSLISTLVQTITKAVNQTEKRRPPLPTDLKIDQKSSSSSVQSPLSNLSTEPEKKRSSLPTDLKIDQKSYSSLISTLVQNITKAINQTEKRKEAESLTSLMYDKFNKIFGRREKQDSDKKQKVESFPDTVKTETAKPRASDSVSLLERLTKRLFSLSDPNSIKQNREEATNTAVRDPKPNAAIAPQQKQVSLLEPEEENTKVLFDGFTDKGVIELKEKLPKILQEAFEDILKKEPEKKEDKKRPSTLMGWLGSLLGPGILKGAMAALAGISGLFISLHGMFTSDWYKGLAKLIGRGLMDFSGFTKIADKFIGKFVSTLIKIPTRIIANFGKSIMGLFGKEVGTTALKTGLGASKSFIPKLIGNVLKFVKKIPFVGSLISIGFAWDRFNKGDYIGGGLEVLSGIAQGFGLSPLSWAIDGLNAFLDYKAGGIGKDKKSKGSMIMEWITSFGSWAKEKIMGMPVIGPLLETSSKIFSDPLGSLKSMALAIPGVESLVGFFESPVENTRQALSTVGNWVSKFGSWAWEKIQNAPILGSLIKGANNIFSGNVMEGLKDLAKATPIGALVSFLANTEAGQAIGEKAKGMIGSLGNFIGNIKDKVLRRILEFLPETILGVSVRSRVADMLGIKMGPVQDDVSVSSPSSNSSPKASGVSSAAVSPAVASDSLTVPVESSAPVIQQPIPQKGDAIVDPHKGLIVSSPKEGAIVQLSKKDGIIAGPISDKNEKHDNVFPKQLTTTGNIEVLRNKKIDEVAENTLKTYKGIEHLTQSIVMLAKALEKTTGVSPTVINNISKGAQTPPSSVTMTQIAQLGNPDIRNVRSSFTKMAY